MQTIFETERRMGSSPSAVWRVMSDVEAWPEWAPTVKALRRLDDGPFGIGSRVEIRQPRLPKAIWQVTELEEGRLFTWESTGPGIRSIGRHEVEATEQGCTVRLGIEQRGPMGLVAAAAWRGLIQRYIDAEAASLETRVLDTIR